MKIEFVEAPPAPRIGKRPKTNKYFRIARELKANPGQWARVLTDANTATSTLIKQGGIVAFQPAGSFEAVARGNGKKGKAVIYAKYIGETEA